MGWFIFKHIFSTIFTFIAIGRQSDLEKDLEILILRQQLSILHRKLNHSLRPNRMEKMTLAVLTNKIRRISHRSVNQYQNIIRIFHPETIFRWHRELVRKKWTYANKNKGGRSSISQALKSLVLQLAGENSRWGYGKIQGELHKLGFAISQSSIRNILNRHGIQPAPVRHGSIGWKHLMAHYKDQILACDFFTIETIWLKIIYVLFFIELGSRRVYLAGVTSNPNQIWITQQARQLVWKLDDNERNLKFLIHDNDTSFSKAFDAVFKSEGFHIVKTPFQAPNANAYAERWVRTVREECLDHILIMNDVHLSRVLMEYIEYYNTARPHQGIEQNTPIPFAHSMHTGTIERRKILGGIINDYYRSPFPVLPA